MFLTCCSFVVVLQKTTFLEKNKVNEYNISESVLYFSLSHHLKSILLHYLNSGIYLLQKDTGVILNFYSKLYISSTYTLKHNFLVNNEYVVIGSKDRKVVLYDLVSRGLVQVLEWHGRLISFICANSKKVLYCIYKISIRN